MTKKLLYTIIGVAVMAVAGIGVLLMMRGDKDGCLEAVPADVSALLRFDLKTFMDDADISVDEGKAFLQSVVENCDASKLGFDLQAPIYGFITDEGNLGAVAAVTDENDLTAQFESLQAQGKATEVTRQRGYSWCVVAQKWLVCFNDTKVMAMGPAVGTAQETLRNEMARLMEQNLKASAAQTDLYAELKELDDAIAAVAEADVLPEEARKLLQKQMRVASLDDVHVALAFDTDKNIVNIDAEVLTKQAELQLNLKALNEVLRPIEGEMTSRAAGNALFWATCNVKGDQLLELLRKQPTVRTALIGLNTVVDADMMLKAVDGDVAVECTSLSFIFGWRRQLPARLLAHLDNDDFLGQSEYWMQSARGKVGYELKEASPKDFVLSMGQKQVWFGVNDKLLYLTGTSALANTDKTTEPNEYLKGEHKDIKGLRFYATLDIEPLTVLLSTFADGALNHILKFEHVNVKMRDAGDFTIELIGPEGKNVVKDIILGL